MGWRDVVFCFGVSDERCTDGAALFVSVLAADAGASGTDALELGLTVRA